ncbi:MAG: amidase [Woeseiaceae bacterium]
MNDPLNRRTFLATTTMAAASVAIGNLWRRAAASSRIPGHDEIIRMSVQEGLRALVSGRLTSLDYCEAALAQAERFRRYHVFSQVSAPDARARAQAVDEKRRQGAATGALEGVPYALKDSVDMVEYYTIAGHPALKTFRPTKDADLVTALRRADAVCIGKTQIPPLSMWWTTENAMTGDTGNPFNWAYKTGGSSGGSGAAVAARITPFAIAEDTAGSIRVPAALNGVIGLRPTTGRWPLAGAVPIGFSDTLGPIARTVADIRLLDTLLAVDGPRPESWQVRLGELRVGYQQADLLTGLHPWVEDNFESTRRVLASAGVRFVEITGIEAQAMTDTAMALLLAEFPDFMARYFNRHGVHDVSALGLLHGLEEDSVIRRMFLESVETAPTGEARYPLVRKLLALREAAEALIRDSRVDVLMYPTTKVPNTRNDGPGSMEQEGPLGRVLSELEIGANMLFAPGMKAPSIALFSGTDPDGLPLSVTFDAPSGADRRLLDVAEAIEKVLPPLAEPDGI